MLHDAAADRLHDLQVDPEKIVAAHAGLARDAGGDDHDIRTGNRRVGVGASIADVEAVDRRRFGDVQCLALRNPLGDVEEHHIPKVLQSGKVGERAADLSGADQRNLSAVHGKSLEILGEFP